MKLTEEQLRTTEPYCTILNKLWKGVKYAVPVKEMCYDTGLNDRALRKCVETIRESGVCVISDYYGYYLPESEEDLERYIRRTEKIARSYFYSLRSAKRELRRMKQEAQIKMEE